MDDRGMARLLRRQCGVVSRRQVLGEGGTDLEIARLVRRRVWARVHEGVYVDHTGPLTRRQQEWAAVLLHEPAALGGRSALRAHGVEHEVAGWLGALGDVEVVVDRSRRVTDRPGVVSSQIRGFADAVLLEASPPRLRLEHAALRVASSARSEDAAVAVLADVVHQGAATSVTSSGLATLVELDGVLAHAAALDRWADLERDIVAAVHGSLTLRAGWQQVLQPCRLALLVGARLSLRPPRDEEDGTRETGRRRPRLVTHQ